MTGFAEWLKIQETSALTRKRSEVARGLQPPMADFMSRSTPPPGELEQLDKKLKKSQKKKKKKKKKKD
jgi:hypothetical protein